MDIYRDRKGVLLSPYRDVMKIYIAQFLGQVREEEQTDAELFVDYLEHIFGKTKVRNNEHPTIVIRNPSHSYKNSPSFGFNSSISARESHKDIFNELLQEVMQEKQLLSTAVSIGTVGKT